MNNNRSHPGPATVWFVLIPVIPTPYVYWWAGIGLAVIVMLVAIGFLSIPKAPSQ